jgi:uncharacterized protein (TIRG00374 family)
MESGETSAPTPQPRNVIFKRIIISFAGIALGGFFLWLALRSISRQDIRSVLEQFNWHWTLAAATVYLASIAGRCVRWWLLLRATADIKLYQAAETLMIGFSANYVLPARIGELVRADYASRFFQMSRFTSIGAIIVERVCDGVILVFALWIGLMFLGARISAADTSWIYVVAIGSAGVFAGALVFIICIQRINLRNIGLSRFVLDRWDRLVTGASSFVQGHTLLIVAFSMMIWLFETVALVLMVRSFGVVLSVPQAIVLLGLATLSTLIPTAPGYLGTYQFVFGHTLSLFGYSQTIGVVSATAIQVFFFGTVTLIGGAVLISRSVIAMAQLRWQ